MSNLSINGWIPDILRGIDRKKDDLAFPMDLVINDKNLIPSHSFGLPKAENLPTWTFEVPVYFGELCELDRILFSVVDGCAINCSISNFNDVISRRYRPDDAEMIIYGGWGVGGDVVNDHIIIFNGLVFTDDNVVKMILTYRSSMALDVLRATVEVIKETVKFYIKGDFHMDGGILESVSIYSLHQKNIFRNVDKQIYTVWDT